MPVNRLSQLELTNAKVDMHADGGVLHLQVTKTGSGQLNKSWLVRYRVGGHHPRESPRRLSPHGLLGGTKSPHGGIGKVLWRRCTGVFAALQFLRRSATEFAGVGRGNFAPGSS
jgi:hypothetical protein